MGMLKIALELAKRGHSITILIPDTLAKFSRLYLEDQHSRYCSVQPHPTCNKTLPPGIMFVVYLPTDDIEQVAANTTDKSPFHAIDALTALAKATCNQLRLRSDIRALGSSAGYQAIVGDVTDFCYPSFAEYLGLPRIDFDTGAAGAVVHLQMYQLLLPTAYVPMYTTELPPAGRTGYPFLDRLRNQATGLLLRAIAYLYIEPTLDKARAELLGDATPAGPGTAGARFRSADYMSSKIDNCMLTIVAADFSYYSALRPTAPHIKLVGPLTPTVPRPLPPALEQFYAGAGAAGVALVSPGSTMWYGPEAMATLLSAMQRLQAERPGLRVVVKVSKDQQAELDRELSPKGGLEALRGAGFLFLAWTPQPDLLADARTVLFVTHCGINSLHEAAWYGVPVVCAPLGADQPDNAAFVVGRGTGGVLTRRTLASGDVAAAAAAIVSVATNPAISENVRAVSRAMRAHANLPMEQAADWVEYYLRSGLPPAALVPVEAYLPWWKTLSLDTIATLAAAALVAVAFTLWCAWRVLRAVVRLATGGAVRGRVRRKVD